MLVNLMQTRFNQHSGLETAEDLNNSRCPSRVGFMRPQLRRQHAFTQIESIEKSNESDDEKDWEFASTLLIPFQASSSDDSDISDEASEGEPESVFVLGKSCSKPALPVKTISVVPASMERSPINFPGELACAPAAAEHDEPYLSLAVTDHGHSRSALSHIKEFWHSRFDEYARMEAQLLHSKAYGGIVEVKRSRDALRALFVQSKTLSQQPSPSESPQSRVSFADPNSPIYPRIGALSCLRDASSASLDRAFCSYPLYSIHKILFLHDMLERSANKNATRKTAARSPLQGSSSPIVSPLHEEDTFVNISLSNSTSDPNDITLVDANPSLCSTHVCHAQGCHDKHKDGVVHNDECTRQWEIDWTARWKVLLESTKDGSLCFRSSSYFSPTIDEAAFLAALSPERPKTPKFFFVEDDDEFSGLDDDEDYGLLVAQPVYRVNAETLSKEYLRVLALQAAA